MIYLEKMKEENTKFKCNRYISNTKDDRDENKDKGIAWNFTNAHTNDIIKQNEAEFLYMYIIDLYKF